MSIEPRSAPRPNIDLRQLRYFVAVAGELNFSRAAARLHISQPPLSQQIKQLEGELGVQLFVRNTRAVELTDIGRLFLEEARETLERVDQAIEIVRRAAAGEVGSVVVGTMSTADVLVYPRVVPAFQRKFPAVKLTLLQAAELDLVDALRDGRVNVGFATLPIATGADVVSECIYCEDFIVAVHAQHRLAGEALVSLDSFANDPWLLPDPLRSPSTHFMVMSICTAEGFTPRAVQFCENAQFMMSLVSGGLGVALLPARVSLVSRPDVKLLPLRGAKRRVELGVLYAPNHATHVATSFIDLVRSAFSDG